MAGATPDPEVLVVTSGSEEVYQQVVTAFSNAFQARCAKHQLGCSRISYEVIALDRVDEIELQHQLHADLRLVITVGRQAASKIANLDLAVPVLHTLIPHKVYQELPPPHAPSLVSAIFIDQPISRRLRLLKEAMPQRTRVGVLISPQSQEIEDEIKRLAKAYGLTPEFGYLENEEQLGGVLNELLDRSDVLLAIPDPFIFNRGSIRNILLSSYHHQIPVIGFSDAYVKAGATIAVFSTPKEIGRQIGEQAADFFSRHDGRLPPPSHPKYFSVAENRRVADSLQIVLPDPTQLETDIQEGAK